MLSGGLAQLGLSSEKWSVTGQWLKRNEMVKAYHFEFDSNIVALLRIITYQNRENAIIANIIKRASMIDL